VTFKYGVLFRENANREYSSLNRAERKDLFDGNEGKKPAERSSLRSLDRLSSRRCAQRVLASFLPASPFPPSLRCTPLGAFHPFPVFQTAVHNVTYADEQAEAAQEAKRLPLCLSFFTPSSHERFIRVRSEDSPSVLATIFQKKSKRRLGNLGERPSPLDHRLYSRGRA